MPKDTYLRRYSLIIKRLERGPATFDQVNRYLENVSDSEGVNYSVSKRTLQRDLKDIYRQLNIEIVNEKKGEKRYFIRSRPEKDEFGQRLLEGFELTEIMRMSESHAAFIEFEKRRSRGLHHMYGLLHAIRNNKVTRIEYQKFYEDEPSFRELFPLYLKESKDRWYLIAEDTYDGRIKTYGLDRIVDIEITKTEFTTDKRSTVDFSSCFGIIQPHEGRPEEIRLSFNTFQGQYIKTFPLHESQKVVKETEDELIVEITVYITQDLVMELLSYGDSLRVLSPQSLITSITTIFNNALKKYGK